MTMLRLLSESVSKVIQEKEEMNTDARKPRFYRLATKLELTQREKGAFLFILVSNVGRYFPPPPSTVNQGEIRAFVYHISKYSGMNSQEIMNFLDPSRVHMQQVFFYFLLLFLLLVKPHPLLFFSFSGR